MDWRIDAMENKRFNFIVVDSAGTLHGVVANYSGIDGGYLCFYCELTGLVLHSFYRPISSLCLGEYIENEDIDNG